MSNVYDQPFPATLATVRKGALVNELTEKLAEVVAGVVQYDKPGELALKLTVKLDKAGLVVIYDELKTKVPEADRPPTWFFATEDGGLTRENPDQPDLLFPRPVQNAEEK